MNEQEIQRLVVRLVGDATGFQKMTRDASSEAKKTAGHVSTAAKQIEGLSRNLRSFSAAAVGALGTFGAATTLQGAFEKFSAFERGQISLKSILVANGREVDSTTKSYLAYADSITSVTLATKGEVMGLLKTAEQMGITGEKAQQLVTNAYALAEGDSDLAQSFVKSLAAMERGNTSMIRRQLKLNDVKDSTELLDRVTKRANAGLQAATEIADTTSGHVDKLKRSMGGLSKDVGKLVADALRPVVDWLQKALNWFKALSPGAQKMTVYVVAALAAIAGIGPILALSAPLVAPLITLFGLLKGALLFLISPVGLVIAAVAALTYVWLKYTESGGATIEWFVQQWETLKFAVGPTIQGIRDSIETGDFGGAFKIAWVQVKLAFLEGTSEVQRYWQYFVVGLKIVWAELSYFVIRQWERVTDSIALGIIEVMRKFNYMSDELAEHAKKGIVLDARIREHQLRFGKDAAVKQAVEEGKAGMQGIKDRIANAREELQGLVQDAAVKRAFHDFFHPAGGPTIKPKIDLGNVPKKPVAIHAALKFEAAAFGSAEALTRLAEYREFGVIGGQGGGKDNQTKQTGLLGQIAKNTDPKNQPTPVVLDEADFEGE